MTGQRTWVRGAALLAAVAAAALSWRFLPLDAAVAAIRSTVEGAGSLGPLLFGALYVVLALLLVPGSAITLAGGAVFGLALGTVVVALSATVAAALAFLLARSVLRARVERAIAARPRLVAVDEAVTEGGWRVVGLLRLSPAVPYGVLNYALGATGVPFAPAVGISAVAMLPGTLLYVGLGAAGADAAVGAARTPAGWALLGVGLAATLAVTVVLTRTARARIAALSSREALAEETDA